MILTAYTKIHSNTKTDPLWGRVESAFPQAQNREYFDDIRSRKNQDSIKESLCALLVLAELVRKVNCDTFDLILGRQETGKPYFVNSEMEFSLSHSRGYAAAAISDCSRVGIDIETAEISSEKATRLAKRFFEESELTEQKAHPDSFLRLWTRKEAYAKMLGTPLSNMIASEKKSARSDSRNAFFYELSADTHPLTVCLERPCEINDLGEIVI